MTTLTGKPILLAGGTGNVGRHFVDEVLAADGTAVVLPRSADKLEALTRSRDKAGRGRLLPLLGDLADEREASALLERLPWTFSPRCHTAGGGVRPECAVCQAERRRTRPVSAPRRSARADPGCRRSTGPSGP